MRDPEARLALEDGVAVRRFVQPVPDDHFLRTTLAQRLVEQRRLLAFELRDAHTSVARRIPFASQPAEWCDAQLLDAAALTLAVQTEAVEAGFDLKDASAWNVLFDGSHPVFCDHASFERLQHRLWWAAGQYTRHFLLPLVVSRRRGINACKTFEVWRDGMPPETARSLLGPRRFLTRYWPLMAAGRHHAARAAPPTAASSASLEDIRAFRRHLNSSFGWMLRGVAPAADAGASRSGWNVYTEGRSHYPTESLDAKRAQIREWLQRLGPGWVADLGCNTGEFSEIALAAGANVVAIDADHDSVQRMYRAHRGNPRLHTAIADLGDLRGGRGWMGSEHPGLFSRMSECADVAMMLAVIHHLAIGASVPLPEVARFALEVTRRWLIVEWIDADDPQLRLLCEQRRRIPADFGMAAQRDAFLAAGFRLADLCELPGVHRALALLEREVSTGPANLSG